MNIRPLVVDDAARQKVKRIVDYALDPAHWYRPGKDSRVPGNDPHFVAHLDTYRCVFTITDGPQGAFRHLTISIPSEQYANVFVAYTIAELFGFTGWDGKSFDLPESWFANANKDEHCVVLCQPYAEKAVA
jgi:hypothetical protein